MIRHLGSGIVRGTGDESTLQFFEIARMLNARYFQRLGTKYCERLLLFRSLAL